MIVHDMHSVLRERRLMKAWYTGFLKVDYKTRIGFGKNNRLGESGEKFGDFRLEKVAKKHGVLRFINIKEFINNAHFESECADCGTAKHHEFLLLVAFFPIVDCGNSGDKIAKRARMIEQRCSIFMF